MKDIYHIEFTKNALMGIVQLKKSDPTSYKKVIKLLEELKINPRIGTGHPEQLKGTSVPTWSRRINHKHRLVYEIMENTITVFILSTYGHYSDK